MSQRGFFPSAGLRFLPLVVLLLLVVAFARRIVLKVRVLVCSLPLLLQLLFRCRFIVCQVGRLVVLLVFLFVWVLFFGLVSLMFFGLWLFAPRVL